MIHNGENIQTEFLILVDTDDQEKGIIEKMEAHRKGLLHRAVSVFLFNNEGKMLLQQRQISKYHCGGLWSNACCSHPRPGESALQAAQRRIFEEMGIITKLSGKFHLVYRAELGDGLIENEYDHIFTGEYSGSINPDSREVMNWRFVFPEEIEIELKDKPEEFTPWFHLLFRKMYPEILQSA